MNFLNTYNRWLGISFIMLFVSLQAQAQLEVQPGSIPPITPSNLITNVFLGEGVEVTSVNYTGNPESVGYFQNATNEIGLERGIIMSSGKVTDAPGAGCPAGPCANTGNTGTASTNMNTAGDANLTALSGQNTNDAAVYHIQFEPVSDTLQFRYVFASEEYETYTCSQYNDVFGFFISGPSPNGGVYNAENIALVPNTSLPVAIGTINSGTPSGGNSASGCTSLAYSQYFVNNISAGLSVEYNGLTTVLTATVVVVPCETYTIKLAIADAVDRALDSSVFLEAKSFGTGSVEVETVTVSLDGTLAEGCSEAVLAFKVKDAVTEDTPLNYVIEGTAQNGIDYTFIPDTLFIPAGEDSVGIEIEAFEDGIDESIETIIIKVEKNVCDTTEIKFQITDRLLEVPDPTDMEICEGDTVQLNISAANSIPPPITFQNTNTQVIAPQQLYSFPIEVTNVPFTELQPGVINSICMNIVNSPLIYDVQVFLTTPGGQILELATHNGPGFVPNGGYINTCFTESASTAINYNPAGHNYAPASAVPFTGNWQPEGYWSDIYGGPVEGTWTLTVYDVAPGFAPTFQDWSITFNNLYFVEYLWIDNTNTLSCTDCPTPLAYPSESTTYNYVVRDAYGCTEMDSVRIEVMELDTPEPICEEQTGSSVTISWNSINGASSYQVSTDGGATYTTVTDTTFQVTGLDPGEEVSFLVIAVSDNCDNSPPGSQNCQAVDCSMTSSLDSVQHVLCHGDTTGIAYLSVMDSTGAVNYQLNDTIGNSTGVFTGLAAGNYTVTITDDLCTITEDIVINEPDTLVATFTTSNVSCHGAEDGQVTVNVQGGVADYTYEWSGGITSTNQQVTGLSGGTYTVTVTDANNCTLVADTTILEPTPLLLTMDSTAVTCNGGTDGTATVTATGGSGTYTYAWSADAQTTATATNLAAGVHSVTVTDEAGCFTTMSVSIPEPTAIQTSTTSIDASCSGSADGTGTVTATGGTGTYTYTWGNGTTTATATGLSVGWHLVTVTDANNCTAVDSVNISTPNPIVINIVGTNVNCNGGTDGTATATVSGGVPPYSYAWNNSTNTTADLTGLAAGTHILTVTDNQGCTLIDSVVITEPTALALTLSSTLVGCNGGTDGTAQVTATGGIAPYTYIWSNNNETTASIANLTSGAYSVTVTDANNCTTMGSVVVNENSALVSSMTSTDVSCNGATDGTATVTASGGSGNLSYAWNDANSQTTAAATNLGAGTYIVTITDTDNNCSLFDTVTIIVPNPILTTMSMTALTCNAANDGTASVSVTGGIEPYTYQWSGSASTITTANNLVEGWHYVTITDGNNCFVSDSIQVTAPAALTISSSSNNISCNGGNDGEITVTVVGGTGAYTYQWTNNLPNSPTQTQLVAGVYTVTVTDENNCTITETVTLTEPEVLAVSLTPTMVTCFGESTGSITTQVTGGVAPYSYAWNTSATTENLADLSIGTYTVTVTDANSCTATAEVVITQPTAITSTMTQQDVACFGAATGVATVSPAGGTAPYTYAWTSGVSTQATASNLSAGTYVVTITDANNCTAVHAVNILQASELGVITSSTGVSCYGFTDGTVTATAAGGTGSYTYDWGAAGTGATISNLSTGTYTVTVTDENACTVTASVFVPTPLGMTIQESISDISCYNGADGGIALAVSEGTAPYTYLWSNGSTTQNITGLSEGIYTVTVTDANACPQTASYTLTSPTELTVSEVHQNISCHGGSNGFVNVSIAGGTPPYATAWNNGALSEDIYNVSAGTYTLVVTDAKYCSTSITVTLSEPSSALVVNMSENQVVCSGGNTASLTVNATGGTGTYSYSWNVNHNAPTITNIGAGNYVVTVTDVNGCTATAQGTVTSLAAIETTITATTPSCHGGNDGTATIELVSGGNGTLLSDYQFIWGTNPLQNTATANHLTGGNTYYVTITDNGGCTAVTSVEIPSLQPLGVELEGDSNASCSSSGNGSLRVNGVGGTAPYTYNWVGIGQTGAEATNLDLGTYQVVVTDANSCTASAYFTVGYPSNLEINTSVSDVSCYGGNNGNIIAEGSGGKGPYTFAWSNGDSLSVVDSLKIGTYSVTMTDANGCTTIASVNVNQPDSLIFSATTQDATCYGDKDGAISVSATGGVAPYMYSYDGGATFIPIAEQVNIEPNTYAIQVQDANMCVSVIDSSTVGSPSAVHVFIQPDSSEVSYEIGDSIELSTAALNMIPPLTWEWSSDIGTVACDTCSQIVANGYDANNYYVTVTDSRGCLAEDKIRVLVTRNFQVYVPSGFTPNGDGVNDVLMVHGSSGIKVKSFKVYDRWGELVFQAENYDINSTDVNHQWNGTFKGNKMNPSVVVWHLTVEYPDGGTELFRGSSTLLR